MENKESSELSAVPRPMEVRRYLSDIIWAVFVKGRKLPLACFEEEEQAESHTRHEKYHRPEELEVVPLSEVVRWTPAMTAAMEAPSDPSGTDSSSATKKAALEERGAVAANEAEVPQMALTIPIYDPTKYLPLRLVPVIVEGGMARWTGSQWESMVGTNEKRPITWPVTWWSPLIHREKKCLSGNGVSSSASSVSSPETSSSSSATVIEEEKWEYRPYTKGPFGDVYAGKELFLAWISKPVGQKIVATANASLERVKKKAEKELGK